MIIGIDPGKSGAIAIFSGKENCILAEHLPHIGDELDVAKLATIIRHHQCPGVPMRAFLEKVGAMPGQGVCSMFSFGRSVGEIRGMLKTMGIPFVEVTPISWKRKILAGLAWKGSKLVSCEYVMRKYPDVDLKPGKCRKAQDGIADAVCIAEFGRAMT